MTDPTGRVPNSGKDDIKRRGPWGIKRPSQKHISPHDNRFSELSSADNEDTNTRQRKKKPSWSLLLLIIVAAIVLSVVIDYALPQFSGDYSSLIYRVIILASVSFSAFYILRNAGIRHVIKYTAIWSLIVAGLAVIYTMQDMPEPSPYFHQQAGNISEPIINSGDGTVIIPRSRDGHFWIGTQINGVNIMMMVDTGASQIVLSPDDATRAGFNLDQLNFSGKAYTANGAVKYALVRDTTVGIGNVTFENVPLTVNGAEMHGSLFGMTLLDKFSSVEFKQDQLILTP